jgi:hypothetical protein
MKLRLITVAASAALVISLLGASGASAATEFGDACFGNDPTEAPITIFEISSTGNPLPTAAPVSGVVTKMKVNLVGGAPTFPVSLKVLREVGPNTVQIVGEANGNVGGGASSIDARIPVQAGDRLGFFSPSSFGAIICEEEGASSIVGVYEGGGTPGGTATFGSGPAPIRVPVFASIEPDADNDGFGDETQDACPQSATTQVACPVVTLSTSTSATKKSVTVLITGTTPANVTVNGKVPLGKGKKAKLKGGTKGVVPGAVTKFKLKFPAKLIKRLKELPPSKKLTLKITSTAPNVAAAPTKKTIRVKLKGQAPTG